VPDWWEFLLLGLASFRLFRLIGYDTVLDGPRDRWLTRRSTVAAGKPGLYRRSLDVFLHCPWCLGWWVVLAWWGAWWLWPHEILVVSVPLALSAFVGLVTKNLDE